MRVVSSRLIQPAKLLFLFFLLVGSRVLSQDARPDPLPLKPAETASPRATLRTFIDDLDFALSNEQRIGTKLRTPRAYFALNRAINALDFSTTPDNGSSQVRIERVLALKEILNRLEAPSVNEIPDERMVIENGIKRWSIPNSNITLQLVESGPNAGKFLFSADTVQRLTRYYEYVKDLPLREDAVPGLYEAYRAELAALAEAEGGIRNQLKPVDTFSPRSTFAGFRTSMNRAFAIVMNVETALSADPPTMTMEEARQHEMRRSC